MRFNLARFWFFETFVLFLLIIVFEYAYSD